MKNSHAKARAAGKRSQVAARRSVIPMPAQTAQSTPYQLTPAASENNAFCWMSWEPQILWRGTKDEVEAQVKRNDTIDQKRAAGIDPLHIHGLGTATQSDPMQFSTLSWKKRA